MSSISSLIILSVLSTINPIAAMPNLSPTKRQNSIAPSSNDSNTGGQGLNIVTVIIPVAIVLGLVAIGVGWAVIRRRNPQTHQTTTQVSGDGVTGVAQRARQYLSRQESGTSVRSLPMYSREAGDQELVLARQSSHLAEDERHSQDSQDETVGLAPPSGDAPRPSIESVASDTSDPMQPLQRASTSASRGPAPTYLEAMSSPLPSERQLEEGNGAVPPPRPTGVREKTQSGVRKLLTRAGLAKRAEQTEELESTASNDALSTHASSHSLLLQPSASRYSTITTGSQRSSTEYPSPWSSSHSLHGVRISSPVPNSAVRASFEAPRGGLTEDQMRFLGSREAVNVAGVPIEGDRRRSRGSSLGERPQVEAPPPSFEEVHLESSGSAPLETSTSEAVTTTTDVETSTTTPSRQQSNSSESTSQTRPPSLRLNSLPAPEIEVQITSPSQTSPKFRKPVPKA